MKFVVLLVFILSSVFSKLDVSKAQLKNGVKVLTVKKNSPVAAVAVIVGSGAYSDPYRKSGLAHYTEHLMFKGLKDEKHGAEFSKFTKSTGANFNAFTGYNTTAYHTVVPAEYLEDLLKMESKRFNRFFVEEQSALTERDVVLEELRMYSNMDSHLLFNDVMSALYAQNAYRNSIAGFQDEVESFTVMDVVKFRKKYYVANNIKIVVISNLDHDVALKKVEKYFGKIRHNKYLTKRPDTAKDVDYPRSNYVIEKVSNQAGLNEVSLFWKMPLYDTNKKEMIAMSVAAKILGNKASGFYKKLVKDDQKATAIYSLNNVTYATNEGCPPNLFILEAISTSKCTADELVSGLFAELDSIRKNGFKEEELQAVKDKFKVDNYYREDNAEHIFRFIIQLGLNYSYKDFLEYGKLLDEIDLTYLNNTFKKYMSRKPDAIGKLIPANQVSGGK